MSIDEVHKATRKYTIHGSISGGYWVISEEPDIRNLSPHKIEACLLTEREAQVVCDRMNFTATMQAVLKNTTASRDFSRTLNQIVEEALNEMIFHISPERHLDTLINKVVAFMNIPPTGTYTTSLVSSTHTQNEGLGTDLYIFKVNSYECIGLFVNCVLTYIGVTLKDRYEHIYLKSGRIKGGHVPGE